MNSVGNPQIADSISTIGAQFKDGNGQFLMPLIYQAAAQALLLGLQNAVAQQQRLHILRNAITAAAAAAILRGRQADADALLERLADGRLTGPLASAQASQEGEAEAPDKSAASSQHSGGPADEIRLFIDGLHALMAELQKLNRPAQENP